MNGIYTASGIDYQREIFLFLVLKYLQEKLLIDAQLEILINKDGKIINIDFLIIKKEGQEKIYLYEVKEGKDILEKENIVSLLKRFHLIHDEDKEKIFWIISSEIPNKTLRKFEDNPAEWTLKNICNVEKHKKCLFSNSINYLCLPRNILGVQSGLSNYTDIALRNLDQIENILNQFYKEKEKLLGKSREVLKSLSELIINLTADMAKKMRSGQKIEQPKISLNDLLYAKGGFVDIYYSVDDFSNEQKYPRQTGETPRDIAFRKFCESFNLTLPIPEEVR